MLVLISIYRHIEDDSGIPENFPCILLKYGQIIALPIFVFTFKRALYCSGTTYSWAPSPDIRGSSTACSSFWLYCSGTTYSWAASPDIRGSPTACSSFWLYCSGTTYSWAPSPDIRGSPTACSSFWLCCSGTTYSCSPSPDIRGSTAGSSLWLYCTYSLKNNRKAGNHQVHR
jgi:hypothetical protein